jgi:predicted PurR-regulated permease PerM
VSNTPAATPPERPESTTEADRSFALPMPISIRSLALVLLATLITIYMLREMAPVLIPIALSVIVYNSLSPLVERLVRWRFPRVLAAAIAVLALVGACGATAYTFSDEAAAVVQKMPEAARRLRGMLRGMRQDGQTSLSQMQQAATAIEATAKEAVGDDIAPRGVMRVQVEEPLFKSGDLMISGTRGLFAFAGGTVLVLVFAFFLLISADTLKRKVVEIAGPTMTRKKITVQILDEISRQIQRFLMVQILTAAIVAVLTGLALWWLGLEEPAIWGIVAGVFNTLPYFGPLFVTVGVGAIALVQFGALGQVLWVAGATLAITTLEGYLLTPVLQGRTAQMNQVAVFVGILFWTWIWGPVGLILAVPLTMIIKVVCDHVEGFQGLGKLMSE